MYCGFIVLLFATAWVWIWAGNFMECIEDEKTKKKCQFRLQHGLNSRSPLIVLHRHVSFKGYHTFCYIISNIWKKCNCLHYCMCNVHTSGVEKYVFNHLRSLNNIHKCWILTIRLWNCLKTHTTAKKTVWVNERRNAHLLFLLQLFNVLLIHCFIFCGNVFRMKLG